MKKPIIITSILTERGFHFFPKFLMVPKSLIFTSPLSSLRYSNIFPDFDLFFHKSLIFSRLVP